jgi:hypothetical protein
MRSLLTPAAALTLTAAVSIGCGFQHSTASPVAPSATSGSGTNPAPSAGNGPTPSITGIWTSDNLPTVPSSCGSFQYEIQSQTATSISGTFMAVCEGGLTASASANGSLNGTAVTITVNGVASLGGSLSCPFTLTSDGTIEDGGNTLRLPYSGTTCLGPVKGTEVLHRPTPAAPSAPDPTPPPPPPPDPSADAIDLHQATVYASPMDIADWPITARITRLDLGATGAAVDFTKKDGPGRWPDVVPPGWDGALEYTLWMVVSVNGRWYTAGGVEYWYGLDRNGGPVNEYAQNWYYSPAVWHELSTHQPAPGEQVGFFVSAGDARAKDVHIVRERSNVVVVPFPSSSGRVFTMAFGQR